MFPGSLIYPFILGRNSLFRASLFDHFIMESEMYDIVLSRAKESTYSWSS
jgi:hypothetical protein